MAKLYFRYSSMNSGKTTTLLQVAYNYEERGQRVLLMKPAVDTKAGRNVQSRLGLERKVDILLTPEQNLREVFLTETHAQKVDCVLIDEAQFLTRDQVNQAFQVAVEENIPVLAYGLRADFRTVGFPGATRLLEIAHTLEELKTICRCGRKAVLNGRKINGVFVKQGAQVAIDGQEVEYESLCGDCYLTKVGPLQ